VYNASYATDILLVCVQHNFKLLVFKVYFVQFSFHRNVISVHLAQTAQPWWFIAVTAVFAVLT